MYREAEKMADKADKNRIRTRLRFHLAHKFGDEKKLMTFHQELEDVIEDQLSLASIHYLRSHYQEAIDIYKRILLDNREHLALNVYVALCYYKLDYYDVSQEVLAVYLQHYPDSAIAINLKVQPFRNQHFHPEISECMYFIFKGCFPGMQSLPAVQREGRRAGIEDVAGPDLIIVQFRQGPHRAQSGRFQEWRRRPAGMETVKTLPRVLSCQIMHKLGPKE